MRVSKQNDFLEILKSSYQLAVSLHFNVCISEQQVTILSPGWNKFRSPYREAQACIR